VGQRILASITVAGRRCSVSLGGGLVSAEARDGSIFAVDEATGARRWRLTTGRDLHLVAPWGVTTVLGLDEWGLAAAWIKRYGGRPGTGFVRVPGDDPMIL